MFSTKKSPKADLNKSPERRFSSFTSSKVSKICMKTKVPEENFAERTLQEDPWANASSQERIQALQVQEPQMIMQALTELEMYLEEPLDRDNTKILDFGCKSGVLGQLLHQEGFQEIYGQDGSSNNVKLATQTGVYREVTHQLVGNHNLHGMFRSRFDIATCHGNLGRGLFPKSCFFQMMTALKRGGLLAFTIRDVYLQKDSDDFGMGYQETLKILQEKDADLIYEIPFQKLKYALRFTAENSHKANGRVQIYQKRH